MEAIADQELKTAITAVSKLIQFENKGQLLNINSAEKIFPSNSSCLRVASKNF